MRWVGVSDRFGCNRIHTQARNRAYLEHVVLGGAHDAEKFDAENAAFGTNGGAHDGEQFDTENAAFGTNRGGPRRRTVS